MRDHIAPELRALVEAGLSPEEFDRRLQVPLEPEELQSTLELIRWFTRRYPTPKERLAYARRKFFEWTRASRVVPQAGK